MLRKGSSPRWCWALPRFPREWSQPEAARDAQGGVFGVCRARGWTGWSLWVPSSSGHALIPWFYTQKAPLSLETFPLLQEIVPWEFLPEKIINIRICMVTAGILHPWHLCLYIRILSQRSIHFKWKVEREANISDVVEYYWCGAWHCWYPVSFRLQLLSVHSLLSCLASSPGVMQRMQICYIKFALFTRVSNPWLMITHFRSSALSRVVLR